MARQKKKHEIAGPKFIKSIREARDDAKNAGITTHLQMFGKEPRSIADMRGAFPGMDTSVPKEKEKDRSQDFDFSRMIKNIRKLREMARVQIKRKGLKPNDLFREKIVNPIVKKLRFKDQAPVLLLNAPSEFAAHAKGFGKGVHTAAKGNYAFVLAFGATMAEWKKIAKLLKGKTEEGAVIWVAYPKGTSKKYKADVNRDSGHAMMGEAGFDGVSLVAIDDDWSAMRFKVK